MTRTLRRHCLLLGILLLLLSGCASGSSKGHASQSGLVAGPTNTPPGWHQVLPGERFTGNSAEAGLTASPARPGRLAGCALPVNSLNAARPVFVLSDDAGYTWQTYHILGVTPFLSCTVLADTQQPDTFVLGPGTIVGPPGGGPLIGAATYLTTDAGRTWRPLAGPHGEIINPTGLVAGHLLAYLYNSATGVWRVAERAPNGTWQLVDATLPGLFPPGAPPGFAQPPQAAAVDPGNPAHIYATMPSGPSGITLYITTDAGSSWHARYQWPMSTSMALWTVGGNRVYAEDLSASPGRTALFFSADGGVTWHGSGIAAPVAPGEDNSDLLFVGPTGRAIVISGPQIFALDPAIGAFTPLGSLPHFGFALFTCAIVEGANPALLCGDGGDTYTFSLPPSTQSR